MRGVDLDAVEAGVQAAPRRLAERPDDLADLAGVHGAGAPLGRREVARPHPLAGLRLVAGVVDLGHDGPPVRVHDVDEARQPGHVLVPADAGHARVRLASRVHEEVTLDDQADVAGRELLVAPHDRRADRATLVGPPARRGAAHEPVAALEGADRERLKEVDDGHGFRATLPHGRRAAPSPRRGLGPCRVQDRTLRRRRRVWSGTSPPDILVRGEPRGGSSGAEATLEGRPAVERRALSSPTRTHGAGHVPRAIVLLPLLAAVMLCVAAGMPAAASPLSPTPSSRTTRTRRHPPSVVDAAAQQHTIHVEGDADWVSFAVTAGKTYAIRTADGTLVESLDTVLSLYDSDGTTLIDSNDDYSGAYSRIIYHPDADKTVYARVEGFGGWKTGAYALSVTLAGDAYEPDDSHAAASADHRSCRCAAAHDRPRGRRGLGLLLRQRRQDLRRRGARRRFAGRRELRAGALRFGRDDSARLR